MLLLIMSALFSCLKINLIQCDDCIDSNIAHHYYANIKKKFKIPALWVLLKFLGQVPIGKSFNFLDIKNRYLAPCAS